MQFTAFDSPDELAIWLARDVAGRLKAALSKRETAVLAVSGGSTPTRFFRQLGGQEVDWGRVSVVLADERFVPPESSRSNQRKVTIELLQAKAARAHLLPLWHDGSVEDAAAAASDLLGPLLPLDVIVLGMGTDGHTASLFPKADRLKEATDMQGQSIFLPVEAPGAGEARITMTLPVIAAARSQYLHIEGAEKREVFDRAQQAGDPAELPIRHVLEQCPDLRVVWSA